MIVADDGAVKITGLGTEAVVQGIECADDKVAAEDAAGIGRVLYAALTARWPGQGGDLPPAPTVDGRTARPRQVRAGVPRELDDVVERTLSRAPHHGAPLRTPREVAEALGAAVPVTGRGAAYLLDVGEDSGSTQPGTAAAPVSALDNGQSAAPPRPAARPVDRRTEPTRRRSRGVARGVGVVAGALLLIGAALIGWQLLTAAFPGLGARVEPDTSAAEGPSSASRTSAPPANARPVTIVAAHDFDPYGDPPEENPDRVARAVDGNPSTTWMTMTYFDPLELLKPGVGLYVDLGKPTDVRSVRLTLVGSPSDVQVRAAPPDALEPPTALSGWAEVASRTGAGERATLTPGTAVRTRYVLVWFTKLPPVGGDYRVEVAEVEVRS